MYLNIDLAIAYYNIEKYIFTHNINMLTREE